MKYLVASLFGLLLSASAAAQHVSLGITFQYHIVKQVSVDAVNLAPAGSYNYYKVFDNNWKFFTAGQSIVIGLVSQLDYKKVYFAFEPSFELNVYDYNLKYVISDTEEETVKFKTTLMQYNFPLYAGFQFKSSNVWRFSIFAGGELALPITIGTGIYLDSQDKSGNDRYNKYDMQNILYNTSPYANGLVGIAFHYASLFRVEVRYRHRLSYPGEQYHATFNTLGIGMTYFLPLNLLKNKIYHED